MAAHILVAGIGNIFLRDDGFGSEVVRNADLPRDDLRVRVVDYGIRGMHLAYDLLEGWDTLVLVDAHYELICQVDVPALDADAAYARREDGSYAITYVPTPNAENNTP